MKMKVINNRYAEINSIKRPIFPCVEITVVEGYGLKFESWLYFHEEDKEKKVTNIYASLLKKEYKIYPGLDINETIDEITTQFLMQGCQCLRWVKPGGSCVYVNGEPVMNLIDSVKETDFLTLSKYI